MLKQLIWVLYSWPYAFMIATIVFSRHVVLNPFPFLVIGVGLCVLAVLCLALMMSFIVDLKLFIWANVLSLAFSLLCSLLLDMTEVFNVDNSTDQHYYWNPHTSLMLNPHVQVIGISLILGCMGLVFFRLGHHLKKREWIANKFFMN